MQEAAIEQWMGAHAIPYERVDDNSWQGGYYYNNRPVRTVMDLDLGAFTREPSCSQGCTFHWRTHLRGETCSTTLPTAPPITTHESVPNMFPSALQCLYRGMSCMTRHSHPTTIATRPSTRARL